MRMYSLCAVRRAAYCTLSVRVVEWWYTQSGTDGGTKMYQIKNTIRGNVKGLWETRAEAEQAASMENMADDYGCWIAVPYGAK